MKPAMRLVRELAGLFFDDGSLAIALLFVLATAAILSNAAWFSPEPQAAMALLVAGVIAALAENVVRTARLSRSGAD
jgi:hypothetical protein